MFWIVWQITKVSGVSKVAVWIASIDLALCLPAAFIFLKSLLRDSKGSRDQLQAACLIMMLALVLELVF